MIQKLILAIYMLSIGLFSVNSQAALFDDKEARKKIIELESAMQSQNKASQSAISELKKNQQDLEAVIKGQGLADMQNQLEALNQEVARLKGDLELANHQIEALQQRQKDLYADTDARIRKLESVVTNSTSVESDQASANVSEENVASTAEATTVQTVKTLPKNSHEFQMLELANGLSKEAKHKEAFAAYDKFLKDFPNSPMAADAKYGLGYSQYALKNYKSAIATQQKLIDMHPDSGKVPDALMNMANAQIQLGQVANAKKSYRSLIEKFPSSELTPTAQKRLKALEAIK